MGDFQNIFKNLRLRDNLSQQELADKLGVSKSSISMYENGNREPDLETLEKIADFFNVDMDFLIGRKEKERENIIYVQEPSYEDVEKLIARNGKKMSTEEKMKLIKMLTEL